MGKMSFTPELLTTNGAEEFNLALFTGTIGDILAEAMDSGVDSFAEYWESETGNDRPDNFFDYISWNWPAMYKDFAGSLPDMLEEAFEDLFTTDPNKSAPVYIGEVADAHTNDPGGWGREYIMAPVRVDGQKLFDLAQEYGVTSIDDGKEVSGFYRTAEDSYWTQIRVIESLIEAMTGSYYERLDSTLIEYAFADGWVDNHIDYGKWLQDL